VREEDVVYLYEHAARELDVACAVTARLRAAGLGVEIVHWPTGFPHAVTRIHPRLVILPFSYAEDSYEALLAYWRKSIFFNLTWEQLFYLGNQKAKTPRGEFALKHVIHHAWSEIYKSFLMSNGLAEKNIFMNGQPAYTLYDKPYRGYFPSREELASHHGLDPERRWVFFPENYNWAFYSEATIQQFVRGGQSIEEINEMREYCIRSLRDVLLWLAFAAQNEKVEIILRPRPSATMEEFQAFVKNILPEVPAHLHILQQGSIREWILASDVILSSHSTSLIEGAVADKSVFIVEPYPMPAALKVGWHDLLSHLKTCDEVNQVCTGIIYEGDTRLKDWARETMMGRDDSIRNLAEFILLLLSGEMDVPPSPSREVATPALKLIPPAWLWSVYRRVKQQIRFGKTGGIEPEYVKDVVSQDEINSRIQKWSRLLAVPG
jgi:surface carbohydrate biosynthesis protein